MEYGTGFLIVVGFLVLSVLIEKIGKLGKLKDQTAISGPSQNPNANSAADFFQRSAKKEDEKRKRAISEHVNRPVPAPTQEALEQVTAATKTRLAIKHVFPPKMPDTNLSFFGGSPVIPTGDEEFDWPMVQNREGCLERLTFLAQIDCSKIPSGPARNLLPETGFLYFFAPMSLNFGFEAHHFVTRYLPGPAKRNWKPHSFPFLGEIAGDFEDAALFRGCTVSYPKQPIEFDWINEATDEELEARASEGLPYEVANIIAQERTEEFYGVPQESAGALLGRPSGLNDRSWLLEEDFPTTRAMVRRMRVRIRAHIIEQRNILKERKDDLSPDDYSAINEALTDLSRRLDKAFEGTNENVDSDTFAVPEAEREEAKDFLRELLASGLPWAQEEKYTRGRDRNSINSWIAEAAIAGTRQVLTTKPNPDTAKIPDNILKALDGRSMAREHHMFGPATVVQDLDDKPERYILLLKLGGDPSLNWLVGEMGPLQYWITPEDLAAKRFENTILTIEAY